MQVTHIPPACIGFMDYLIKGYLRIQIFHALNGLNFKYNIQTL
jgi:hypothetical protein